MLSWALFPPLSLSLLLVETHSCRGWSWVNSPLLMKNIPTLPTPWKGSRWGGSSRAFKMDSAACFPWTPFSLPPFSQGKEPPALSKCLLAYLQTEMSLVSSWALCVPDWEEELNLTLSQPLKDDGAGRRSLAFFRGQGLCQNVEHDKRRQAKHLNTYNLTLLWGKVSTSTF